MAGSSGALRAAFPGIVGIVALFFLFTRDITWFLQFAVPAVVTGEDAAAGVRAELPAR